MAGGSLGALFGAAWMRRSRYGVDRRLLESHARWLTSEETALILQAPIDAMLLPTTVLRESGEIPPAVFVLHPKRVSVTEEATSPGPPLSPVQVQEHARRLATDHKVDPEPRRNTRPLERLERARRCVDVVRSDLTEAVRLEQSVTPVNERLPDNEYIVESNARDVQLNLLKHFIRGCRRLPTSRTGASRASTAWPRSSPNPRSARAPISPVD
jgi:cyclic beta-1,2-glucan synthetase